MLVSALVIGLISPIAMIFSIFGLWVNPSKWKFYLLLLVYSIFVVSYCYVPMEGSNSDLMRYLPEVEQYGKLTLQEAFHYHNETLYFRDILFWLFGHLGMPRLAPAFTTATVYGIAGYLTCDVAEQYHRREYIGFILLIQSMMLPFVSIICNVRNIFGLSLIVLAAYLDIIKKNHKPYVWVLYLCGILMHLSCFVLVIFRLLSRFAKSLFEVVLIIPLVFSSIIIILYQYREKFRIGGALGDTIQTIIRKLYNYLTNTDAAYSIVSTTHRSFILNRWIMTTGMVLCIVLIYYTIRINKKVYKGNLQFNAFAGCIASLTLANNVFSMPNYWRFAAVFYVLFGVIYIPIYSKKNKMPILIQLDMYICILIAPIGLLLQFWDTRHYDFMGWFVRCFQTDYLTMLYEILIGVKNWLHVL